MDEEKVKDLQEFLLGQNLSLDVLSKARISQLSKVYDAVKRRKEVIAQAKKDMAANTITLLSISKETEISRKTFYNNEILKTYVERAATDIDMSKAYAEEVNDCKNEISRLREENRLLKLRDFDNLKLQHNIDELSRELDEKDNRIRSLETEYEKVVQQLTKLRQQAISRKEAVILDFQEVN